MILYVFLFFVSLWIYASYQVLVHIGAKTASSPVRTYSNPTHDLSYTGTNLASVVQAAPKPSPDDCYWPPVTPEGNFPCGNDELPYSHLKVPKFWIPPHEDFAEWNSLIDGEETIFIMIASYRDFQCRETITSAFARASHPERLFIGAVDQVVPGDIGCVDLDVPCSTDSDQVGPMHVGFQPLNCVFWL
jgi:hypothetical protein